MVLHDLKEEKKITEKMFWREKVDLVFKLCVNNSQD